MIVEEKDNYINTFTMFKNEDIVIYKSFSDKKVVYDVYFQYLNIKSKFLEYELLFKELDINFDKFSLYIEDPNKNPPPPKYDYYIDKNAPYNKGHIVYDLSLTSKEDGYSQETNIFIEINKKINVNEIKDIKPIFNNGELEKILLYSNNDVYVLNKTKINLDEYTKPNFILINKIKKEDFKNNYHSDKNLSNLKTDFKIDEYLYDFELFIKWNQVDFERVEDIPTHQYLNEKITKKPTLRNGEKIFYFVKNKEGNFETYKDLVKEAKSNKDDINIYYYILKDINLTYKGNFDNKDFIIRNEFKKYFLLDLNGNVTIEPNLKLTHLIKKSKIFTKTEYITADQMVKDYRFGDITKGFLINALIGVYNSYKDSVNLFFTQLNKYDFIGWTVNQVDESRYEDDVFLKIFQKGMALNTQNKIKIKNPKNEIILYPVFRVSAKNIVLKNPEQFFNDLRSHYIFNKNIAIVELQGPKINYDDFIFKDKNTNIFYAGYYDSTTQQMSYKVLDVQLTYKDEGPEFIDYSSTNNFAKIKNMGLRSLKSKYDFLGYNLFPSTANLYKYIDNEEKIKIYSPIYTSKEIKNSNEFLKNSKEIKLFNSNDFKNKNNTFYAFFVDSGRVWKNAIGADTIIEKEPENKGQNTEEISKQEQLKQTVEDTTKDFLKTIKDAINKLSPGLFEKLKISFIIIFSVGAGLILIIGFLKILKLLK